MALNRLERALTATNAGIEKVKYICEFSSDCANESTIL